ncbi:hypothetical protein HDU79_000449, partial [Rhizoclosmatium sp. JEL0117]
MQSITQYFEKKVKNSAIPLSQSPSSVTLDVESIELLPTPEAPMTQQLFSQMFEGMNIEVYGTPEEPLFKANDIGSFLKITNIRSSIQKLGLEVGQDVDSVYVLDSNGHKQQTTMFTEEGLYGFLVICWKEKAKTFRKWVMSVIKELRLKGKHDLEEKLRKVSQSAEEREKQLTDTAEQEKQRHIEAAEQRVTAEKQRLLEANQKLSAEVAAKEAELEKAKNIYPVFQETTCHQN